MKNILEYAEKAAAFFPGKTAIADENTALTYRGLLEAVQAVGTVLARRLKKRNAPVAVMMERSAASLAGMLGVTASGNFYTVVDPQMPLERVRTIFSALHPEAVLADNVQLARAGELGVPVISYEEALSAPADEALLLSIRARAIDTDPLYALFTSGSTGVPKGAVVCHRSVMAYADWVTEAFSIDGNTVFGNQTPFYFSMSVLDIFSALRNAATVQVIPKVLFSFPIRLMEFLQQRNVNTIYWVPSALCIVANWKLFSYAQLPELKKVLFAGEVMPVKQLNYWMDSLPGALFANLYGPTEVTDICTYFVVNRRFADSDSLPIGQACNNCDVFVVKEDGTEAAPGEEGELYVRGSFLALGYYGNPEKTAAAFVQNPLNKNYPEPVYRTGDLVRCNERGELLYLTRKDFQIKHMGYRIELGEAEAAVNALPGVTACACVYDAQQDEIICIYEGKPREDEVRTGAALRLPAYMMPSRFLRTREMPHNQNGKIDRNWLKNNYRSMIK